MYWANFLHIYQPYDQMSDILEMVVNQSYRPIFHGLKTNPKAKITLNVNAALIELLHKYKYKDLIDDLRQLGSSGQVEFTSSAKYHAFLPFLSDKEIVRQIKANDDTNKFYLGEAYDPKGFFPPEMAYNSKVGAVAASLGYKWIIIDEIAYNGNVEQVDYHKIYKIKGLDLKVYFRERRISNLIMSAMVRSTGSLYETIEKDLKSGRYLITAMDGETFGHHRPGLDKLLMEIYASDKYELIHVSDIEKYFKETVEVEPIESTWASSTNDIEKKIQFLSWNDPENIIHTWQKEFVEWVLSRVRNLDPKTPQYEELMKKMDVALASDHFWWASAKPWWSVEMIEIGSFRLLDLIYNLPDVTEAEKNRAQDYYQKIMTTAFDWQRTGKIRQMAQEQHELLRIPFKEKAPKEIYDSVITLMKRQMDEAIKKEEFEKAILWRDAIIKIDKKHDIYDTIHAVDLLRLELPPGEIEALSDKYKEQYRKIRSGQPEQRGA